MNQINFYTKLMMFRSQTLDELSSIILGLTGLQLHAARRKYSKLAYNVDDQDHDHVILL